MTQRGGTWAEDLLRRLNLDPACPPIRSLSITRDITMMASVVTIYYENGYGQRLLFSDQLLMDRRAVVDPLELMVERIRMDWPTMLQPSGMRLSFEGDGSLQTINVPADARPVMPEIRLLIDPRLLPPGVEQQLTKKKPRAKAKPAPTYARIENKEQRAEDQPLWQKP